MLENLFDAKTKVLRSDNGGESASNVFQAYLQTNGIESQTSCGYTTYHNGVAESKKSKRIGGYYITDITYKCSDDVVVRCCPHNCFFRLSQYNF